MLSRVLRRRIPTITGGRMCPHVLYDLNCRIVQASFQLATT